MTTPIVTVADFQGVAGRWISIGGSEGGLARWRYGDRCRLPYRR
ncbi:MAG: hypothetical protein ACYCTF_13330 [Acidiferrobacter sp.]